MRQSLRSFCLCFCDSKLQDTLLIFFPCNRNLSVHRDWFYPLSMHSLYLRAHTWETEAMWLDLRCFLQWKSSFNLGLSHLHTQERKKKKKVATNSNIAHATLKGKKRRDETFSLKEKCGWPSTWIFREHSLKLFKLFSLKKIFTLFIIGQNSQLDVWPKGSEASSWVQTLNAEDQSRLL